MLGQLCLILQNKARKNEYVNCSQLQIITISLLNKLFLTNSLKLPPQIHHHLKFNSKHSKIKISITKFKIYITRLINIKFLININSLFQKSDSYFYNDIQNYFLPAFSRFFPQKFHSPMCNSLSAIFSHQNISEPKFYGRKNKNSNLDISLS